MNKQTDIDLDALEQKALAATPGPWDVDTIKNEGDYGIGPDDCRTGFMSFSVHDKDGRALFDSLNRDTGISEIHEEYSDDHIYAWDEKAKRDIEYTVAANPSVILELIRRLREAERDAARYRWVRDNGPLYHGVPLVTDESVDDGMAKGSDK